MKRAEVVALERLPSNLFGHPEAANVGPWTIWAPHGPGDAIAVSRILDGLDPAPRCGVVRVGAKVVAYWCRALIADAPSTYALSLSADT